jgi:iron(III) transport system permease protein
MTTNTLDMAAMAEQVRRPMLPTGWLSVVLVLGLVLFLVLFLVVPLGFMLQRSLHNARGEFVGIANYLSYFSKPAAFRILGNSFYVAAVSTIITVLAALIYAFALTRTCMPWKGLFRSVALLPLVTPSLLSAMALVQLFGNQGVLKGLLQGESIYGPIGIVLGMSVAHFPHVFLILSVALSIADARLYETAESLRAGRIRRFRTVTLPTIKYGLISAIIISVTLSITDFGIPKVIGGQFDVLATEIYKQVVGQQNFEMGAVVSIVLLVPALIAFVIDRAARRRQTAMLTANVVPLRPKPRRGLDALAFCYCLAVSIVLLAMIVVPGYTSFTKFWPYNLELTLANYQFDLFAGGGWESYLNSLKMAVLTAVIGTIVIFVGAYLEEKSRASARLRGFYHLLSVFPVAVPGLVLGLSYIFFLNNPANPLEVLYGTLAILVISTIVHYYTVSHLTAVTALRQLDGEFELVSDSLKAPRWRIFLRVTVPVCMPAILNISIYLFLNAMTTVSAVVFLYSHNTSLASIAVINMDDAGEYAPAAAMAMVIVGTCVLARCIHLVATHRLSARSQAWIAR